MSLTDITIKNAKKGKNTVRIYDKSNDPLLKGLHLEVLPSGLKTFKISYTHPTNNKQRQFFSLGHYSPNYTLQQAREDARKARSLILQKIDPKEHAELTRQEEQAKIDAENKIGSVDQLFDFYIQDMVISKKRSASDVENMYKRDIKAEIGTMKAKDVTAHHVSKIVSNIAARGAITLSKRTHSYINAAFAFGKKIKTNSRWVNHPELPEFILELHQAFEIKHDEDDENHEGELALTSEQIKTLWSTIGVTAMSQDAALAVKFLLATGQRVEEVLHAPWKEFDLKQALWTIPFHRRKNKAKNKSKSPHLVFLTPFQLSILKEIKKLSGNSIYLFPNPKGTGCKSSGSLNQAVKRFCTPQGRSKRKPFQVFNPRDLRRTWKTRAGEIGIDLEIRNRVQGHAFSDIGSKHYDRWSYAPEKQAAMQKWSDWLEEITSKPLEEGKLQND
ncbi:MAG: integrase arm-type DNA-binding domain-containing protein [Methylobacter sp.]|uniref:tyrosine-type recombinase/integrase n=1 Tax=Methylobacter sp. TaxID=2051955 RepID=UPI00258D8BBB|nr:site-specific integrase [Methylobacter sp.]MCL7423241.1 integrase arm-type DNA-binding domain-containing protein [Methylobacter sp.]